MVYKGMVEPVRSEEMNRDVEKVGSGGRRAQFQFNIYITNLIALGTIVGFAVKPPGDFIYALLIVPPVSSPVSQCLALLVLLCKLYLFLLRRLVLQV